MPRKNFSTESPISAVSGTPKTMEKSKTTWDVLLAKSEELFRSPPCLRRSRESCSQWALPRKPSSKPQELRTARSARSILATPVKSSAAGTSSVKVSQTTVDYLAKSAEIFKTPAHVKLRLAYLEAKLGAGPGEKQVSTKTTLSSRSPEVFCTAEKSQNTLSL